MLLTIILFVAIILLLVLSHEFGHFYFAKKSGMRVEEFGFGFPPRIAKYKKGDTTYSFNLFPIGGFVKIFGEDGEKRGEEGSFTSKPIWKRSVVIGAGIAINLFLAYVLFSAGHFFGTPTVLEDGQVPGQYVENVAVQIVEVFENSPAQSAGLQLGDNIKGLSVEGDNVIVEDSSQLQNFISEHSREDILFTLERGGEQLQISVSTRSDAEEGQGAVGIAFVKSGVVKYPFYIAPIEGAKTFWLATTGTFSAFGTMIKNLVATGNVPDDVTGPVGIFHLTGVVRSLGFVHVIQFTALISLSLGIINLVPFPALDGGRLLFLAIEKVKGSPLPKKAEGIAHAVGFIILILLIIAITVRDIDRFF